MKIFFHSIFTLIGWKYRNKIEEEDALMIAISNASTSELKEEKIYLDFCKQKWDKGSGKLCWCCRVTNPA